MSTKKTNHYGWVGRILRINLSTGAIQFIPTDKYEKYIGGRGIAAKIFYDEVAPEVEPFDPGNKLVFMTGPLTGTPFPCAGRIEIAAKSPVAYPKPIWVRSSVGGFFGPELKFAGYDGIIVEGKAKKPSIICIEDDIVTIRERSDLWGLDTFETQRRIAESEGTKAQVMCIGPAGENLVRDAIILHHTGHASGLAGLGSVMGSKNLKAIVVTGKQGAVHVADPAEVLRLTKKLNDQIYKSENPPGLTACSSDFKSNIMEHQDSAEEFVKNHMFGKKACFNCPISCYPKLKIPGLANSTQICYWTIFPAFGSTTWRESWEIGQMADRFGIGLYSVASFRNWLLELNNKGLISDGDLGIKIRSGNFDFYKELIPMIAHREGFGDILAEGIPRTAALLKKGEDQFFNYNGWVDYFVDVRESAYGVLGLATGTRIEHEDQFGSPMVHGLTPEDKPITSDNVKSIYKEIFGNGDAIDPSTLKGKAIPTMHTQNYRMLMDTIPLCKRIFPYLFNGYKDDHRGEMDIHSQMFNAATGKNLDEKDLLKSGARIFNLERLLGIKYGYHSKQHDLQALDSRLFKEQHERSELTGKKIDRVEFEIELERYYRKRGWHPETGIPMDETLHKLGLSEFIDGNKDFNEEN
jgi:aldehyde:ferredoxin oxidoreductase